MKTSRREFLRNGALGALGLGLMRPLETALAATRPRRSALGVASADPVVVAVNLFGGNDGLNTVVPLAQYARYRELRRVLGVEREQLVPLPGYEEDFALNPGLRALTDLFTRGRVAIVNGVGCPPNAQGLFDHEASQQNFLTGQTFGSAPPAQPTGWLGRYLDRLEPAALPAAFDFSGASLLLTGAVTEPLSLYALSGFGIYPSADYEARSLAHARLQDILPASAVAERSSGLRKQVLELSGVLQGIHDQYSIAPGVTYPLTPLADALRDCAALIAAERGVRALAVGLQGFDTHAAQNDPPPDSASHRDLWTVVSEALAAFHADLSAHGLGGRVVTLVFSEFGRRAIENNDLGTDHGFAGPALVIGDSVKGGIYGDYPDLRDESLIFDGNLNVHVDFRSVYATILARHFGADPEPILGGAFEQIGFL